MTARAVVPCPSCGGAGEAPLRHTPKSLDYPDGVAEWETCRECEGTGQTPEWFANAIREEQGR